MNSPKITILSDISRFGYVTVQEQIELGSNKGFERVYTPGEFQNLLNSVVNIYNSYPGVKITNRINSFNPYTGHDDPSLKQLSMALQQIIP